MKKHLAMLLGLVTAVGLLVSPVAAHATVVPCGTRTTRPVYHHVVWILMENKTYGAVIGNAAAPYISGVAKQCASDSHWNDAGSTYNSLPNYIALSTGITSSTTLGPFKCDCPPSSTVNTTGDNIFRQVRTAGKTEKSYDEGMPSNCAYTGGTSYAAKHNPALYMWGGTDKSACLTNDVPMGTNVSGALVSAITAGTLPNFAFVTPNLCNDMHDCSVTVGDNFLKVLLPKILAGPNYVKGDTAVIIVWDEDSPVPNVVISPSVTPGVVSATTITHYSLLKATEKMLGLPLLGGAVTAVGMRALFNL